MATTTTQFRDRAHAGRLLAERLRKYAGQFDAVLHIDETSAVEPLERTSEWEAGELPETYPWGV